MLAVLAVRAALRVLPTMQSARGESFRSFRGDQLPDAALMIFRAVHGAWVLSKFQHGMVTTVSNALDALEAVRNSTLNDPADTAAVLDVTAAAVEAALHLPGRKSELVLNAAASNIVSATAACLRSDIDAVANGQNPRFILDQKLWTPAQPSWIAKLWSEMKQDLLAAEQDWDVWTDWYEARLKGEASFGALETARALISDEIWKQGPAKVNAEIKLLIAEHEPRYYGVPLDTGRIVRSSDGASMSVTEDKPRRSGKTKQKPPVIPETPPTLPAPIENVPSPVSFGWSSKSTITVVIGELNWPAFPFEGGKQDHEHRLEACRTLASDIARKLQQQKWNVRDEYKETLADYAAYLPKHPEEGNFLLADAQARIIRHMFAEEKAILPFAFSVKLKVLLEQHIGLRAYYPEIPAFYESVRKGHLEQPLPIDAIEGFIKGVRDNTPTLFEPNVAGTLQGVERPVPNIAVPIMEAPKSTDEQLAPPPDPLGEVDPEKSRQFTLASGVNDLCKVMSEGEKVGKNVEGWSKAVGTLAPYAAPILEWLRVYLGS